MKKIVLLLVFVPVLVFSQSKRKTRQMESRANAELVANLKSHVQYLSDDRLEGRRSGTEGEQLAARYIISQYEKMGLAPAGNNGYLQQFEISEGRLPDASTLLRIDGKPLLLNTDFFPLAFSAGKKVTGSPSIALSETREPWFMDVKELLEENKDNPHFDLEDAIKKKADKVARKGGTALFVYNTSSLVDNLRFNRNDKSTASIIPVVYITRRAFDSYFSDQSATLHLDLNIAFSDKKRWAHNVAGFIDNHAANTVILGAHFDHLGYGEDKTALDTGYVIHNGADDNASGTAALIELARMLKKAAPAGNNYLIINFSGEEQGLLGSKYWLDHPTINIHPNYMINMDMVGRYDTAHKLTIGGYGTSPLWGQVFASIKNSLQIRFDSTGSGPSDHAAFYRKEIPVLFFFTGSHSDYHKATDDWDRINYDAEKEIVKLIYQILERTANKGSLAFAKTSEPQIGRTGFKVTLGVIPDYGFGGVGMRIDGVSPGKLAEKIGLRAGDVLLQLGEYKFADVYVYTAVLAKFNKGDRTKLRIKRGNDEQVFDVEFDK